MAVGSALGTQAGVEGVAEAVTDEVDRQHDQRDQGTGHDRAPDVDLHVAATVAEQAAPGREVGGEAETEEGDRRLGQDRGGDAERRRHDDRAHHVGQHVADDDAAGFRCPHSGPRARTLLP